MKLVFIMHHHHASFATDISKIYNSEKYKLYGLFNKVSHTPLVARNQHGLFAGIFLSEDYSVETLQPFIEDVIDKNPDAEEVIFVTGAEHDVVVCGRLNGKYNQKFKASEAIKNYDRFNNKIVMKDILRNTDVRLPKYLRFDKTQYHANPQAYLQTIKDTIPFPIFVKPIDQNGSFGTEKIENDAQLGLWAASIAVHENSYEYEVDEFIEGTLYHCDSFIKNGRIIYTQVSEDMFPCYEFMCGKPEGSIVLGETDPVHTQLRDFTTNALTKLGLPQDGITHMEVFRKNNGEIIFLEVAFRPGGAVIPPMYEKYFGRDIRVDHILLQIDPEHTIEIKYGDFAAWVSYPLQKGLVVQCNNAELLSPKRDMWKVNVGHQVNGDNQTIADEAYHVFFWNSDITQLRSDFENLRGFRPLTVRDNRILETSVDRRISFSGFQTVRAPAPIHGSSPDIVFPPLSLDDTQRAASPSGMSADLSITAEQQGNSSGRITPTHKK